MSAATTLETHLRAFCSGEGIRAAAAQLVRGSAGAAAVNGDLRLPSASVAKVAVAITLCRRANTSALNLDAEVTTMELPTSRYPSVTAAFASNHTFTVRELMRLSLITSDNPIATYLLNLVGTDAVNEELHACGCKQSMVRASFRDDELGPPNRANVTTATDALQLILTAVTTPSLSDVALALSNNLRAARIPLRLPDETRVAHKTGTLRGVVNDVGVVYGRNSDLAIAILTDAQRDNARTAMEIGDCIASIWADLGEEVESAKS